MKVLVTGASGFLGSHVAEQLVAEGHAVRALVRKSSKVEHLRSLAGVELAYGAVEDEASVRAAALGVDGVIHVAGVVKAKNEAEFQRVNVDGTRHAVEAAKAAGVKRFVLVSSLTVAGPSYDGEPVKKESRNPLTAYGRSKLASEDVALAEKGALHLVVLRPSMIYGPRDNEALAFFQSVARRFLPFIGDGSNKLSVTYATDCAALCVRALTADVPSGSVYFVDDGDRRPWRDMLGDVEAALGRRAWVRFSVPLPVLGLAAAASEFVGKAQDKAVMLTRDKVNELAAPHWVCDSADAQRDLGWTPKVRWAEGARLTADWYRKHGWL